MLEQAQAKACCADLYQSDLARSILGDTLHPGGLALTHRLGRLMDIQPGDWVVDLASARGASAMAVSRVFKCKVVGVEFGRGAVAEAHAAAQKSPGGAQTYHVQGDAEQPPLHPGVFDAVFCECSMSLFMDKPAVVKEAAGLLRPGGRFGLSDVTVEPGALPPELDGPLGQLLCLSDALPVDGYAALLESAGLSLVHRVDASIEGIKVVEELEAKLGALTSWLNFTGQPGPDPDLLRQGPGLLARLKELIKGGQLGYWLFVAMN